MVLRRIAFIIGPRAEPQFQQRQRTVNQRSVSGTKKSRPDRAAKIPGAESEKSPIKILPDGDREMT